MTSFKLRHFKSCVFFVSSHVTVNNLVQDGDISFHNKRNFILFILVSKAFILLTVCGNLSSESYTLLLTCHKCDKPGAEK